MMRAATLLVAATPLAFARVENTDLNKDQAITALGRIASLKSMDMEVRDEREEGGSASAGPSPLAAARPAPPRPAAHTHAHTSWGDRT